MDAIRNRIRSALNSLEGLCYIHREKITGIEVCEGDYHFEETCSKEAIGGTWRLFGADETWGGRDRHYWFMTEIACRQEWEGKEVRVTLNTGASDIWNTDNPQIMVYLNGVLTGTMDMNHQDLILSQKGKEGEVFQLAFYAYSNSEINSNFFRLMASVYDHETASLYYDIKVLLEAGELLPEEDLERIEVFKILNHCVCLLDLRRPGSEAFYASVKEASDYIRRSYYEIRKGSAVTVHSIGHTHIDVAWKWPLKQTRQKTVRSFNTVLGLMERYPEYKFMSSQPQLYQFVKEEAPGLYERIKEKIAEGRWEAEGGMWLEPDCNLASGESLIRHILYGRRFFEKELGASANEVLWLPDVFGYSAAIPQIMKKSGLSYFMTTKLGWNEYNKFPYDTFTWRGIDGSEVLTYLISTRNYIPQWEAGKPASNSTTYNGLQNPSQIMGTWQRYQNKDVSKEVLTCYGYGDGGGGPTEEMLEQDLRLKHGVVRCPQTKQTFVKDFFHLLDERMDRKYLPVWSGELYLEFHRGTYTSMAKNKWYNRRCEFLNGDAEFYSVLARAAGADLPYPAEELEKNWKLLLLNQFHDILPGSSIKEVYEDSEVQYKAILESDGRLIRQAKEAILGQMDQMKVHGSLAVFNTLSFVRTGVAIAKADGGCTGEGCTSEECISGAGPWQKAADGSLLFLAESVPSKGLKIFGRSYLEEKPKLSANEPELFINKSKLSPNEPVIQNIQTDDRGWPVSITTPFYFMEFNGQGEIRRIFDRTEERELLKKGTLGNQLLVYEDRPLEFDAWNIDPTYEERVWEFGGVTEFKLEENGPVRAVLSVKRTFMDSSLEQKICFYRHTSRIDFKTTADWHEHQMLLKTAFPLDIQCNEADYEIQFGNVSRPTHTNTTWDKARFEVCAHKWADLSEYGYGAALLNDCKYGYDIHDSVMRLTLIKSGIFPNPDADQGHHAFTYALYPHKGDFRQGGVIQEAYDLNCPLEAHFIREEAAAEVKAACSCPAASYLEIREPNIISDTIKMAEDGKGVIIRFYEAYGMRTKVHVSLPMLKELKAAQCDCMEMVDSPHLCPENEREMKQNGTKLEFEMKPYEIKTIRIF